MIELKLFWDQILSGTVQFPLLMPYRRVLMHFSPWLYSIGIEISIDKKI